MDPRLDLAQVLKDLASTTSHPQAQAPVQGYQYQQQQQQQQQQAASYDPRRIYQPDLPNPVPEQVPQQYIQHAAAPTPAVERVDPRTITQWPAALKYITQNIVPNQVAMDRLKKMKLHQREHEKQWWQSREAILKRHASSSSNRERMDSVLKMFSTTATSAELSPEAKLQELATYDDKVYRTSVQMYNSMAEDFKALRIPFFVITEQEFPGDKETFAGVRKKVVELIDDLT